jgi:rubrerythrin
MPLTTFGAIMGFAAEICEKTAKVYGDLLGKAKDAKLRELLQTLAAEEGKTHALMGKARRENVTEMILEPVSGLRKEEYQVDLKPGNEPGDAGLLKVITALEEREKRFFRDAALKVPLPEVARIFRKIAQKKEESLNRLQTLSLS